MKHAQLMVEFIGIFAIGFFLLVLSASLIGWQIQDISNKREFSLIDDLGRSVQLEIDQAALSQPGYERTFSIPEDLDGVPYNVSIIQSSLIVQTGQKELVYKIPKTTGAILKGTNVIRNEQGAILLN